MIKEIDYNKILSQDAIEKLNQKMQEPGERMSQMEIMQNIQRYLPLALMVEKDYRPQLEEIAERVVREAFPVIDDMDIIIDAKIVDNPQIEMDQEEEEEEEMKFPSFELPQDEEEDGVRDADAKKRRLINGLTQGASVRGSYLFNLIRDELNEIHPDLHEVYNKILKSTFGLYDFMEFDEEQLQQMSASEDQSMGKSKAETDEEGDMKIIARAKTFPYLVHEIVKGLYELVGKHGFTRKDKDYNQKVADKVDTLFNELDDIKLGKYIYDAVNKVIIDKVGADFDPRLREYFLVDMYKLKSSLFIPLIEHIIMGELQPVEENWIDQKLEEIIDDLKADDMDQALSEDQKKTLNKEIKINKPSYGIIYKHKGPARDDVHRFLYKPIKSIKPGTSIYQAKEFDDGISLAHMGGDDFETYLFSQHNISDKFYEFKDYLDKRKIKYRVVENNPYTNIQVPGFGKHVETVEWEN